VINDVDDEQIKILIFSGSDRGRRIRVMAKSLIHKGPPVERPPLVDECRVWAVNVADVPARLYLNDGRSTERVIILPARSELVPISITLQAGDTLTGTADLKNYVYVWGKAIRRREPPPTRLQRAIAWLSLLWLDVKGAIRK
jgi:hypothetical protein